MARSRSVAPAILPPEPAPTAPQLGTWSVRPAEQPIIQRRINSGMPLPLFEMLRDNIQDLIFQFNALESELYERDAVNPFAQGPAKNLPAAEKEEIDSALVDLLVELRRGVRRWLIQNPESPYQARMTQLLQDVQDNFAGIVSGWPAKSKYMTLYEWGGPVALLERVRSDYGIGDPAKYVFLEDAAWNDKARELGFNVPESHTNYGGTIGGPHRPLHPTDVSYMFVGRTHLEKWLQEGNIGNIVNTIAHEYVHVLQFHDQAFQEAENPIEVWEMPAYWRELRLALAFMQQGRFEELADPSSIMHAVIEFRNVFTAAPPSARQEFRDEKKAVDKIYTEIFSNLRKPHLAVLKVLDEGMFTNLYGERLEETVWTLGEYRVAEQPLLSEESVKKRSEYQEL